MMCHLSTLQLFTLFCINFVHLHNFPYPFVCLFWINKNIRNMIRLGFGLLFFSLLNSWLSFLWNFRLSFRNEKVKNLIQFDTIKIDGWNGNMIHWIVYRLSIYTIGNNNHFSSQQLSFSIHFKKIYKIFINI